MIQAPKERLEMIRRASAIPKNLPDNGDTNAVTAQTDTDKQETETPMAYHHSRKTKEDAPRKILC